MRVMVFGMADEASEKGELPPMEAFEAMDRFIEELSQAGVLVAAAGLKPTSQSKRVVFHGPRCTVIDGPFAETREVIAGFSIWEVKDMGEAVAWARRYPQFTSGESRIELRPFLEAEDLADALPPDSGGPRDGERAKLGVA